MKKLSAEDFGLQEYEYNILTETPPIFLSYQASTNDTWPNPAIQHTYSVHPEIIEQNRDFERIFVTGGPVVFVPRQSQIKITVHCPGCDGRIKFLIPNSQINITGFCKCGSKLLITI